MGKLDGKVAIVTGAGRGLGRAYARRLAGLGAKIAVVDLDLRSYREFDDETKDMTAESTVTEIEALGGSALGIKLDVRDHQAVEAMVARVVEQWGRVDVSRQCWWRPRPTGRHQGEHDRPHAPRSRYRHEPVWHGLLLQCRRAGHETTTER